jgi:hypothetical protein
MRVVLSILITLFAVTASGQRLTFIAKTYAFGKISDKEKVHAQIRLRNSGKEVLEISEVKPGCGCTAGQLGKNILEAGEETVLDITFDPKGKLGTVRKSIQFTSNDTVNSSQLFFITADIKPSWDFIPRRFTFSVLDGVYDRMSDTITVVNNGDHILEVREIMIRNGNITVDGPSPTTIAPGAQEVYTVTIAPLYIPKKAVRTNLVFKTHYDTTLRHRTIPFWINVKVTPPPVEPEPPVALDPEPPEEER